MYLGSNCLTKVDKKYFFGGWSSGFFTTQQKKVYAPSVTNTDAFVYAYEFDHASSYSCLYESEVSRSDMNGEWRVFYSESKFYSDKLAEFYDDNEDLRKTYLQNYFTPYVSKYSGGFDLQDTIIIPKPCAYKSSNLTSVTYYRGQNTYRYDVAKQNR